MASMGSTSAQEPTFKERLADLEQALEKLQDQLKVQVHPTRPSSDSEGESLDSINNDLRNLKKEFDSSTEGIVEFKDDVFTQFKDAAVTFGDFGRRITALEIAVKKILTKLDIK